MTRFFKILLWIFAGLFSLTIAIMIIAYIYLSSEWRNYYSDSDIKRYADSINRAPSLDNTYYFINDKLHNNDRHKGMAAYCFRIIWNNLILREHINETNYYIAAARIISFDEQKQKRGYPAFTLAWAVAKYATPEKCFDYSKIIENRELIHHGMFYKDTIKNICNLKDTNEILEYIIRAEAPSKYRRNPHEVKQRFEKLKIKLKE